jgi:hypothetical protein
MSAAGKECEKCSILHFAISEMHRDWEGDHSDDKDDQDWYLGDSTEVSIYVRKGHGLRVSLINEGSQFRGVSTKVDDLTFEFYTRSTAGVFG